MLQVIHQMGTIAYPQGFRFPQCSHATAAAGITWERRKRAMRHDQGRLEIVGAQASGAGRGWRIRIPPGAGRNRSGACLLWSRRSPASRQLRPPKFDLGGGRRLTHCGDRAVRRVSAPSGRGAGPPLCGGDRGARPAPGSLRERRRRAVRQLDRLKPLRLRADASRETVLRASGTIFHRGAACPLEAYRARRGC
jgi:hypothetical protein